MRKRFTLDSATPSIPVSLDWQAEALTIYNPTPNLIAVRIGSTGIPSSVPAAEIWIGPYAAQTYPVEGVSYGLVMLPVREGQPLEEDALLPQRALITFTRNEPPPNYAAVDFSVTATNEALIIQQDERPADTYTDGPYDVPSFCRTLIVRAVGVNTNLMVVTALPSGRTTFVANVSTIAEQNDLNGGEIFIPWYVSTDTQVEIHYVCGGATLNGYQIRASRFSYAGEWREVRGAQRVSVMPLGLSALPVTIDGPDPLPVETEATRLTSGSLFNGTFNTVQSLAFQLSKGARGVGLWTRVTAAPGGGQTLAISLFKRNPILGNSLLLGNLAAPMAAIGDSAIIAYPGMAAGAVASFTYINAPAQDVLRVNLTPSGAGNWTAQTMYEEFV